MRRLAARLDRIIHTILASLPPGDLTFERSSFPGLIAYTLRIKQVKVGQIEIESDTPPSLGLLIRFSIIPNNFTVIQGGEEFILEITNLNEVIMQAITSETGPRRWREIAPEPLPQFPSSQLPDRRSGLVEQKVYADLAYFFYRSRQPWENIPDHLWDRLAVKLWCAGLSNQDIARYVNVHPRSVTNRISHLRQRYPKAGIPTHKQRIKLLLRDD